MDLSGHENNSANNRPDLTIPMPSCLVAGAMAAAAQAAQDSKALQSNKQLILSNNGNAGVPGSSPGAVSTVPGVLAAATTPGGTPVSTAITVTTPTTTPGGMTPESKDGAKPGEAKKVRYRECLKNHAAGIGGHALDGCGEFMPNKEDETSMLCAACDCHRNFHRREVEGEKPPVTPGSEDGGPRGKRLSEFHHGITPGSTGGLKKRFRTKFSTEQKERMYVLSEKLGWRIQKHDEAEVAQFCADTGVKRHVLKVWMHNNKHTFGNKRLSSSDAAHEPT